MKDIAVNKKAYHDYFIEDRYEAGMVLLGTEIKSVRMGKVSMKEAYVSFSNGEAFVKDLHIAQYKEAIDQWGGTLVLLFRNEQEANRFNLADFPLLPNKIVIGTDIDNKILTEICTEMHLKGTPPIFIIADTFNRVVFLSEGYTIGLGEQLARAISSL